MDKFRIKILQVFWKLIWSGSFFQEIIWSDLRWPKKRSSNSLKKSTIAARQTYTYTTTSKSLFHQCLKNYLGCWWNLSSLRMICWMWKVGTIFALTCFRVHHQTLKQNAVQGVLKKSGNASQITKDHNIC